MEPSTGLTLNLLLRGGTVGVLLLIAAALWRDQHTRVATRLGAAFAIGVAAATLAAMPGFGAIPHLDHAAIAALAAGNMFVFWLFTRALLDDDFKARPWHLALWAALAGIGALNCLIVVPQHLPTAPALGLFTGQCRSRGRYSRSRSRSRVGAPISSRADANCAPAAFRGSPISVFMPWAACARNPAITPRPAHLLAASRRAPQVSLRSRRQGQARRTRAHR